MSIVSQQSTWRLNPALVTTDEIAFFETALEMNRNYLLEVLEISKTFKR